MKLTTTEKLIIAMAYGLYGEDNFEQIFNYLRCNGVELEALEIQDTHSKLKEESKEHGYSNVLSFCEDRRYLKGVELYNTYKELLWDALENKIEECEVSSSEEESPIGPQTYSKIIKPPKKKEQTMDLGSLGGIEKVKFQNETQMQIEPKTINRSISRTLKIESAVSLKEKKRFYWKLSEEEKLIDDYFDILDERVDFKQNTTNEKENTFYKVFPAVESVKKSKEDLMVLEIADEKIRKEFEFILNKITSVRRLDKDKSLWRSEIKVLLDFVMTGIGYKEKFKEIKGKVDLSSLSQVIVLILLQLQDIIIKDEESEVVNTCGVLKKYTALFYDFYKK